MRIEAQIQELHRYDKKLNKRIKKVHKILHEKQLEHEKSLNDLRGYNDNLVELVDDHHKKIELLILGRSSSCPELIPVEHRLDTQEKEIQGLHKRFLAHEAEYRLIKEDLQRLGTKQRRSEERDESTRREIELLKRANAKNQYH
jgi:predicted HicB family RNase H-like nuclease